MQTSTRASSFLQSSQELFEAQISLEEAIQLVEVSRVLFHKKLGVIQQKVEGETSEAQRRQLHDEAKELYRQYTTSLDVIENYIDEISRSVA